RPADPARPGPAQAAAPGPGGPSRAGQGARAEPDRPGAARRHRPHPDGQPAACAGRAAGRAARPGRRRTRPGRGRTARPRGLGRECLAEVRTAVGMLREDDAAGSPADGLAGDRAGGRAPLPGAGGLPALVEQFRSAGADVTLTVEGDIAGLPATTGLAVYRI